MAYMEIGKFERQFGVSRFGEFKRPVTFYDRVRFVGADSSIEIMGGTITGALTGGDYTSSAWDGGSDLSGGADATATTGFFMDDSAGAAQFQTLYAEGGELGSLAVVGNLTLDGGTILTSASGERIEITDDKIEFNTGTGTEYQVGQLYSSAASNTVRLELFGHTVGTVSTELVKPQLRLIGDDGTSIDMDIVLGVDYSAVSPTKDVNTTISLVAYAAGSGIGEIEAFASEGFSLGDGTIGTGAPLMQPDNGATNPPWSFVGDTNTGMYRYAADAIGWTLGGTVRMYLERDSGTGEVRLHLGGESNDWIAYDPAGEYFSFVRQSTQEPLRLASAADGGNIISFDTSPYTGSVSGLMVNSGGSYTALQAYRKTTTGANNIQQWRSNKTSTAQTHAYVQADGDFYNTNGTYGTISDERLKENMRPATSQWDDFLQVEFINYSLEGADEKLLGVGAQTLGKVFPKLVKEGEDGVLAVKQSILYGPVMGSVVQELQQRVIALEAKLEICYNDKETRR